MNGIEFRWMKITDTDYRTKVIGGWIVKSYFINPIGDRRTNSSIVFVPDPNHEWLIQG